MEDFKYLQNKTRGRMLDNYNRLSPKERDKFNDNLAGKTIKKYLEIYKDYVMEGHTIYSLSEKWDITPSNISKILKWATSQIPDNARDEQVKDTIYKAIEREKEIRALLPQAKSTYEKLAIHRELRMLDTYISQVKGIMKNVIVDNKKINNTINFVHSVVNRRTGDVIESKAENIVDENATLLKGKVKE